MVTTIEPSEAAWRLVEQNLLSAVPKDVWEANARGGFCTREDSLPTAEAAAAADVEEGWCCAVCLGEEPQGVKVLRCGHMFHECCLRPWFRVSNRCPMCRRRVCWAPTPALVLPDMDFELQPWPLLPDGVVASDEPTAAQLRVLASRAKAAQGARARAGARLRQRFGAEPKPRFFEELVPSEACGLVGLAAVALRWRGEREQAAEELERRAAAGSKVVCWPRGRRWPAPPPNERAARRRAAVAARSQARHQARLRARRALRLACGRTAGGDTLALEPNNAIAEPNNIADLDREVGRGVYGTVSKRHPCAREAVSAGPSYA